MHYMFFAEDILVNPDQEEEEPMDDEEYRARRALSAQRKKRLARYGKVDERFLKLAAAFSKK